jgi:hypothetical protein
MKTAKCSKNAKRRSTITSRAEARAVAVIIRQHTKTGVEPPATLTGFQQRDVEVWQPRAGAPHGF